MALVGRVPFVLIVNKDLPIKSVPELVDYAKANKIFYASGGPGSPHHLYAEMFKGMTGIDMTHVPYKGSADAIKDVRGRTCPGDVLRPRAVVAAGRERHSAGAWRRRSDALADSAGHPAACRGGRAGLRRVGLVHDCGPAGTPQPIVERSACRSQGGHGQ